MKNLYQKDAEIVMNSELMMDKLIDKVEKYKTDRDNLPPDADGIYLIVEGKAKVINRFKNYDYDSQRCGKGDFFGDSKFIKSQGFSYFGDIIACKAEQTEDNKQKSNKKSVQKSLQRRSTEKKQENEPTEKEPDHTTCMFLPAHLLYLIPYYDYYDIRESQRKREEFINMRSLAMKTYRETIRRMDKQRDQLDQHNQP